MVIAKKATALQDHVRKRLASARDAERKSVTRSRATCNGVKLIRAFIRIRKTPDSKQQQKSERASGSCELDVCLSARHRAQLCHAVTRHLQRRETDQSIHSNTAKHKTQSNNNKCERARAAEQAFEYGKTQDKKRACFGIM
jgi:hypothetical protein